jgi:hypothetical protein
MTLLSYLALPIKSRMCYRKLGGDVLDIELNTANVYTAYEEAVLEYSYIVNVHQANNSLSSYLGHRTGSFDDLGHLKVYRGYDTCHHLIGWKACSAKVSKV